MCIVKEGARTEVTERRSERHSHLSVNPDFLEGSVDTGVQRFSVCTPEFVRYKLRHSHTEKKTVCVLCFFHGEAGNTVWAEEWAGEWKSEESDYSVRRKDEV